MSKFNSGDRVKYVGYKKEINNAEGTIQSITFRETWIGKISRKIISGYGYRVNFDKSGLYYLPICEDALEPILHQQNHIPEEVRAIFRESVKA